MSVAGGERSGRRGATRALAAAGAWLALWSLSAASLAWGQAASQPAPEPSPAAGAPPPPRAEASRRPGRYRLGPFYLTPLFKIGTIGLDTNALYTPTGARADLTASGGPGLEVVLPVRRALRLRGIGNLTYLYFARNSSQRRLMGSLTGRLEWEGSRTGLALDVSEAQSRARPSIEVDRRLLYTDRAQRLRLQRRLFGRTRLMLEALHQRREVDEGEAHLGVDLRSALSIEDYRLTADLDYGLTVKTSLAATYERQFSRYFYAADREANGERLMAGIRTDSTALISGQAMAGVLRMRARASGPVLRQGAVYDVSATLNLSAKTHIGGSYRRDIGFSALAVGAATPTLLTETYGAHLEKDLVAGLNLEVFARRTWLRDDGDLELLLPNGEVYQGTRRDTADELGGDLGYRFRTRLRLGVAASYLKRRSTVSYFGIDGLLVGLSVRYTP